jgi:hypothetical protein
MDVLGWEALLYVWRYDMYRKHSKAYGVLRVCIGMGAGKSYHSKGRAGGILVRGARKAGREGRDYTQSVESISRLGNDT